MTEKTKHIKLIALDLDGTTLDAQGRLPKENKIAIEKAHEIGISVAIATGRSLDSIPAEAAGLNAIRYIVSSNGAKIWDKELKKTIYTSCLKPEATEKIVSILSETNFAAEAFINGKAYISRKHYEKAKRGITAHRRKEYILETRNPVDDFYGFVLKHKASIENFNILFEDMKDKLCMKNKLLGIEETTLTSSFPSNWELGGMTTGKGTALKFLCEHIGVLTDRLLVCGDSPNDLSMMKEAGVAVAMGNAEPEVKRAADMITATNSEGGVAEAIQKVCLINFKQS